MEAPAAPRAPALGASRRARSLIALCRGRLFATRPGRASRAFAVLSALGFGGAAVVLSASGGAAGELAGLTHQAAALLPWFVGGPIALAAARDRASTDRTDGIEALAAARGISASSMESARTLGAMAAAAWAMGAPLVFVASLVAALSPRPAMVFARIGAVLGALAFSLIAGVTLGTLGAVCGRIARRRGAWLLLAVVVGPWALADLAGHDGWSVPGALRAVREFSLGGASERS